MPQQDTPALIAALAGADVRFIVVGGVAAIAHGASTFTRDLDVLTVFDVGNLSRVLTALTAHAPRFALHPDRPPLTQTASMLAEFNNLYLVTDLGRIDILGSLPNGGYDDVAPRSVTMQLAGVDCGVLSLDDLIASKEALGRPKDRLSLVELRAIRDRLSRAED